MNQILIHQKSKHSIEFSNYEIIVFGDVNLNKLNLIRYRYKRDEIESFTHEKFDLESKNLNALNYILELEKFNQKLVLLILENDGNIFRYAKVFSDDNIDNILRALKNNTISKKRAPERLQNNIDIEIEMF